MLNFDSDFRLRSVPLLLRCAQLSVLLFLAWYNADLVWKAFEFPNTQDHKIVTAPQTVPDILSCIFCNHDDCLENV